MKYNSIMIVGTTASGKTKIAAHLADFFNSEIISADSRQVYKQLNIGAGKDYDEYVINSRKIPYHIIDIANINETFYLKDFAFHAANAFEEILIKGKMPIICGGTGLYIDVLLKNFDRMFIPEDQILREELIKLTTDELRERLIQYPDYEKYNFDLKSRKRLVRAIEIITHNTEESKVHYQSKLNCNSLIIGLKLDAEMRRKKISDRLSLRLKNGLIEEVQDLIEQGFTREQLVFLGLEYKFITQFLFHEIDINEMKQRLEIAIHQFAKRQATWFRKMEKEGFQINWIEADDTLENIYNSALNIITSKISTAH